MELRSDEEHYYWSQFKSGDREAFAVIYQQHSHSLIGYGLKLCPDRHLLKDQIQELFVELWNTRENLSLNCSLKFYLFRALRYKLIRIEKVSHTRSNTARLAMDQGGSLLQYPVETSIIEKEMHESQTAVLRRAIRSLPLRQQEIIQLRYYQGFSHDQIAELMEMNYQSVSNLMHRALVRLKEIVKMPVFQSFIFLFFFF